MAPKMKTQSELMIELKAENEKLKEQNAILKSSKKEDTGTALALQYKKELDDVKTIHNSELKELRDKLAQLERKNILLGDKADRTKEVLKLSAFGFAAGNIHTILNNEKGIDITLQEVIRIVDNIDNMPPEEYLFYSQCRKEFTDKVTIDPSFFSTTVYKKYMLLETTLSEQLTKAKELDDSKMIHTYTESLMKLYGEMAKVFAKNGIDVKRESALDDLNNDIVKKDEEPAQQSSKTISFGKLKKA